MRYLRKKGFTIQLNLEILVRYWLDVIYEIQTDEGETLVREIGAMQSVFNASILDHDGSLRY